MFTAIYSVTALFFVDYNESFLWFILIGNLLSIAFSYVMMEKGENISLYYQEFVIGLAITIPLIIILVYRLL